MSKRERDGRRFEQFGLHCMICGAVEFSSGNTKLHVTSECSSSRRPDGSRGPVQMLCGCCGQIFTDVAVLLMHANTFGFHRRTSSIPGYSVSMSVPELLALPIPPPAVSVTTPPVPRPSIPPYGSDPTHAAPAASFDTSSAWSSLYFRCFQENRHLRELHTALAYHLIWLSGCVEQSVSSFAAPDPQELALRQFLSTLPGWPVELQGSTLPLPQLLARLSPVYTSWAMHPPLE